MGQRLVHVFSSHKFHSSTLELLLSLGVLFHVDVADAKTEHNNRIVLVSIYNRLDVFEVFGGLDVILIEEELVGLLQI